MPSPFPGMDPFIELFEWQDFHHAAIDVMREFLAPLVRGAYIVRVERRIYLEHFVEDDELRVADVAVADGYAVDALQSPVTAAQIAPTVECVLPMPQEQRESYLLIKERESREVVTVIELLSPNNKRRGSDGREIYLNKRESILQTRSHLVELDLLRGGERLPMRTPLPPGDYYAIVSRAGKRPRADVTAWALPARLPQIAIPLKSEDADVVLDLQKVLDTVYDRAFYGDSIDYHAQLDPPLDDEQNSWAKELFAET